MDRDIAINILGKLKNYKNKIEEINDNKYVPHIVTQPVDYTGAVGDRAVFTVVANNVKGYQWQVRAANQSTWSNSGSSGNKTDTLTIPITESRYGFSYRCVITGLDNSVIYSDAAKIIEPET